MDSRRTADGNPHCGESVPSPIRTKEARPQTELPEGNSHVRQHPWRVVVASGMGELARANHNGRS